MWCINFQSKCLLLVAATSLAFAGEKDHFEGQYRVQMSVCMVRVVSVEQFVMLNAVLVPICHEIRQKLLRCSIELILI
jgi:hypothetical protein